MKSFTVNHWGSKPGTNDDCWTGEDFETLSEAKIAFFTPADSDVEYVELDGPEVHLERRNPTFDSRVGTNADEWRLEIAREEGMLHGVDAYNEVLGY